MDWCVRKAEFKQSLSEEVIDEVLAKLGTLLGRIYLKVVSLAELRSRSEVRCQNCNMEGN